MHADYDTWLKGSPRMNPFRATAITEPARTTLMPIWKRRIMGREVVVAITAGKLDFSPWEQIFYGEFDGGRHSAC